MTEDAQPEQEQNRFAKLPDRILPEDWVAEQDEEPLPWSVYTAPDVAEENARRWGFGG
jgi:hypothetical protein